MGRANGELKEVVVVVANPIGLTDARMGYYSIYIEAATCLSVCLSIGGVS